MIVRSQVGARAQVPGDRQGHLRARATRRARSCRWRRRTPHPVEIDQVLNTFDAPTRHGDPAEPGRSSATRSPAAGPDINAALGELQPLVAAARAGGAQHGLLEDRASAPSSTPSADSAAEVAPVAETQAQMFVDLDTTFGAFAAVARPFIQETISETPPTLDTLTRTAPRIRRFLGHSATLFADLRPGRQVARARTRPRSHPRSRPAPTSCRARRAATTSSRRPRRRWRRSPTDPGVKGGRHALDPVSNFLTPTLRFIAPAQSVCNYATLAVPQRVRAAQRRRRRRHLAAVHCSCAAAQVNSRRGQRAQQRGQPLLGSGERPDRRLPARTSCTSTRTRTPRRPGQPHECEAGNEKYIAEQGRDRQPARVNQDQTDGADRADEPPASKAARPREARPGPSPGPTSGSSAATTAGRARS